MQGVVQTIEILPNRLYWHCDKSVPSNPKIFWFSIDETLVYLPYNTDFGPLDLSMIFKFCKDLSFYLENPKYSKQIIYHHTSLIPSKRTNACLLMGAFQILSLNRSAEESWLCFQSLPRFLFFRDASSEGSSFELTIFDCLKSIEKAKNLGWFTLDTFDIVSYERFNDISKGNLNFIVPNKFIAFSNPISRTNSQGLTVEQYCEIFKELNVNAIIRLNEITYDRGKFVRKGFKHYELFFQDGSVPSSEVVERFLEISEKENLIAIHCQAGLGRTGTLIGCYVIQNHDFTGNEVIAWTRMCRSGSVLGPQQHFLCEYYSAKMGNLNCEKPLMTNYEKFKAEYGDLGQADRLSVLSNREESDEKEKESKVNVKYKTKYNQLVNIDPVMLKLYGKKKDK